MHIAILGRQPKIGLAELESLLGSDFIKPLNYEVAYIDTDEIDYSRFGSVIKFGTVLDSFASSSNEHLQKSLIKIINSQFPNGVDGKLKIGFSAYGGFIKPQTLNSMGLSIKKSLKNKGFSLRIVPNKTTSLSSAQVIHNRLTGNNGIELIIIKEADKFIIAKTVFEQDIEAYTARDQMRPKRDARVGMLPPKLAQTIINLATGQIGELGLGNRNWDKTTPTQQNIAPTSPLPITQPPAPVLLDPFCGTGVILQEALLMNYSVYGTDLEPRMIDYSKTNLEWLKNKYPKINGDVHLKTGDATSYKWQPMPTIIAGESFLGRPLSSLPGRDELNSIVQAVNTLHKKVFENIYKQMPAGSRLCLAVPAWQTKPGKFISLPILDQLAKIGYNQLEFKLVNTQDLIYARADQIVGRQLVVLTK